MPPSQFRPQGFLALGHGPTMIGREDWFEKEGQIAQQRLDGTNLPIVPHVT
jgi:hypothetical protein